MNLLTFTLMFCWASGIGIHDNGASFVLISLMNLSKMEMTFKVLIENLTVIQLLETLCSQEHAIGCCPELVESKHMFRALKTCPDRRFHIIESSLVWGVCSSLPNLKAKDYPQSGLAI